MIVSAISVWVAWVVLGRTDAVDVIVDEVEKQFVDAQQWIVLIFFNYKLFYITLLNPYWFF